MSEETQLVEWKSSWRDEWLQWLSGYANAQGGILEIGKDDVGTVIGVKNTKKLMEDIPNKIRDGLGIVADVDLKHQDGKSYIAISVPPYSFPISYHSHYYYRTGSTRQELTGRALDEFMMRKMGKTWDSAPNPLVKFEELDKDSFTEFRKKAIASRRLTKTDLDITDRELLDSLRLVDGDYLTNAAVLLFHKDPDRFIPGSYVKIGYFEDGANLLYQDEIYGSLVTLVDKIVDMLFTKYLKGIIHYEGIQRVDEYPVDKDSAREAILNSLIHKDNTRGTPVQIKVFPDSVFIFNVGRLPDSLTVESLFKKHGSEPRNPLVASAMFRTGMIEAWGRGIEKIVEGCERIGAPKPVIEQTGGGMTVEFFAPKSAIPPKSNRTNEKPISTSEKPIKADKKPIKREQAIIEFVTMHGEISNKEARELLGLADSTTKRLMSDMAKKGSLEAFGDRKNRTYRLPGSL